MSGRWLVAALLPVGSLVVVVPSGRAQNAASPENIAAALKLTQAAAAEYEFRVGNDNKPLDLHREPVLKWSNPEVGNTQGGVLLWTRDGRPLVVGCLFLWLSERPTMEHEFHSLAEEPLAAKFHGDPVWKTDEAGVRFAEVPGAPAPAATEPQRLSQLRLLAKEFAARGNFPKTSGDVELRLLPQPLHHYAAPKQGVLTGGVFAFVRATDPEIVLVIEARGKDTATARWQYAAVRMHSRAELRLRHKDKLVWESNPVPWEDVFDRHALPYTSFRFKEIPGFLKSAIDKPER